MPTWRMMSLMTIAVDSRAADDKNWEITTLEFSVTKSVLGDTDQLNAKAEVTASAAPGGPADPAAAAAAITTGDEVVRDDDDSDEWTGTKTVSLSTEMTPDGRTYTTKKSVTCSVLSCVACTLGSPDLPYFRGKPPGRTNLPYSVSQILASLRRHCDT